MIEIFSPFSEPRTITLREHLKDLYYASGTKGIKLTNEDFIYKTASQQGLGHEDREIDQDIYYANSSGLLIGGVPPKVRKLVILGEHVYKAGVDFLNKISNG